MKIRYESWAPGADARAIVRKAEEICAHRWPEVEAFLGGAS